MTMDRVARARSLIGCRFRPQGRSPALGLDCIGLALQVYEVADGFRRDYRLGGDYLKEIKSGLAPHFRRVARTQQDAGDLLLWRISDHQLHLGISAGRTFVHADAKLGQVVETPSPAPWRLIGVYRRRVRQARKT